MAQWNAINTKRVHPTTNVPLVNYKRVPRLSGMFGAPPQCLPTAEGAAILGNRELLAWAAEAGVVPVSQEGAVEGSFSSKEGWELYKAVRRAANNAGEGTSSSTLRSKATAPAEHIAGCMEEGVAGLGDVQELARPCDQESSHGGSQAGGDMEQDWLQECSDLEHEVPWADLMG